MDTSSIRRHATAAITAALAAAAILAAVVLAAPTPADAAQPASPVAPWQPASLRNQDLVTSPQAPADPNGAVIFRNGRFTPLGSIPGAAAAAHINRNNRGQTVGFYADNQGAIRSFVKDQRGRVATFAVPGAAATFAGGINNRGQIAGTYFEPGAALGNPDNPPDAVHGFTRQPGGQITTIDLPPRFDGTLVTDINDRGQVVGTTTDAAGREVGFLREPNGQVTVINLRGSSRICYPLALNDRGQVVGSYLDAGASQPDCTPTPNRYHGFVWERGRSTRLDVPRSLLTGAFGINNAGQITGSYLDAAGSKHGFLLQQGRYAKIDAPDRTATDAWGVNDRGEIVIPELGTGLAAGTR